MLKMTRHGQITIPKELREQFNLQEGDYLETSVTANGILLRPVSVTPKKLTMPDIVARAKRELPEAVSVSSADELKRLIDAL